MKTVLMALLALIPSAETPDLILQHVRSLAVLPRQVSDEYRPLEPLALTHHEPGGMTTYENMGASVALDATTGRLWAITDRYGWRGPSPSASRLPEAQLRSIGAKVAKLFEQPGWSIVLEPGSWNGNEYDISFRRALSHQPSIMGGVVGHIITLDGTTGATLWARAGAPDPEILPQNLVPGISAEQARGLAMALMAQHGQAETADVLRSGWVYAVPDFGGNFKHDLHQMTAAHRARQSRREGQLMYAYMITSPHGPGVAWVDGLTGQPLAYRCYISLTAAAQASPTVRLEAGRWMGWNSEGPFSGRMKPARETGEPSGRPLLLEQDHRTVRVRWDAKKGLLWHGGRAYQPDAPLRKGLQKVPVEVSRVHPVGKKGMPSR